MGIRIPKSIADESSLSEGDEIEIATEGNRIIITPRKPEYTLKQLLQGMSEEHLHSEVDWGKPVGREHW